MDGAIIRTEGLTKEYVMGAETIHALRGIDLEIQRNEYVALMGPSGSGKSTFMNLIGCLDTPTAGEYWLNGTAVARLTDDQLAAIRNREIGFVFQTFNLLPRATALHNVELPLIYGGTGARERRQKAEHVLDRVGLADDPAILLADEPTGNLDSKTGAEIMALFDELHASGQTILLVTHEHDIALHAHRRITLLDGLVETDEVQRERVAV
jgi:putative ABC transport system ATP-binding protein